MQIRRKPRKSPLNDFVFMIAPDRIEEAYDRVDSYFTEHLKLNFDSPEGVAGVLTELIRDHGVKVRKALYALLCEENGSLRSMMNGAAETGGEKSTVGFLVPVISAQFNLAPAVALLVATLVIKTTAAHGEKSVCEELIQLNRKTTRHLDSIDPRKRAGQQRTTAPRRRTAESGGDKKTARQKRGGETGGTTAAAPRRRNGAETSAGAGGQKQPAQQRRAPAGEAAAASPRRRNSAEPGPRAEAENKPARKRRETVGETTPAAPRRQTKRKPASHENPQ
jgi:hypothetical protein